jgi:hypothetical protein
VWPAWLAAPGGCRRRRAGDVSSPAGAPVSSAVSSQVCAAVTFAEQVPALAGRRARRTAGLTGALEAIALALGGRAGARMSGRLSSSASRSTLLRLIRALPGLPVTGPRVLGVDDFALRRGHACGTVLIDIETRRPVDVLPERSAESFESWLRSRPGVEVICRDRGGCCAEGAARGAPLAVQVADRWHLLHTLADAVGRAAARHRSCLRDDAAPPGTAPPRAAPAEPEGQRAHKARDRHARVRAAAARGLTITQISRDLHLDRKTVRRYAAATDPPACSRTPLPGGPGSWIPTWPTCTSGETKAATAPTSCTPNSAAAATAAACAPCDATPPPSARALAPRHARPRPHRRRWPPGS